MLYKFKSKTTADLFMLEPNGRQVLTLMGKGDANDLIKGILEPADMPGAIAALKQAIAHEDEVRKAAASDNTSDNGGHGPSVAVSLGQRAAPMLKMIQLCHAKNTPIVWGV